MLVELILKNHNRFFRFLMVGLLNTIFGYGIFVLLLFLGMHFTAALFFATIIGVLFNFKTIGCLVFKSNDNRLVFHFTASYTIVYIVNVIGLKLLSFIGINMYIGGAILVLPMAILAYILNKRFVFKNA